MEEKKWTSPMGYHNHHMRDGKHAPFAICGSEPNKGRGVLFWAYTSDEANRAYDAYRACGYRNVCLVEDIDVDSLCEEPA